MQKFKPLILLRLSILYFSVLLLLFACSKEEQVNLEMDKVLPEYSESVSIYTTNSELYIKVEITGDSKTHVDEFLSLFELSVVEEPFTAESISDLEIDDSDPELQRDKGQIKLSIVDENFNKSGKDFQWLIKRKERSLKAAETAVDRVTFTNSRKPDNMYGAISIYNTPAEDDIVKVDWDRKWGWTLYPDDGWTYTKTDFLEYMIQGTSYFYYGGKYMRANVTYIYANYYVSQQSYVNSVIIEYNI